MIEIAYVSNLAHPSLVTLNRQLLCTIWANCLLNCRQLEMARECETWLLFRTCQCSSKVQLNRYLRLHSVTFWRRWFLKLSRDLWPGQFLQRFDAFILQHGPVNLCFLLGTWFIIALCTLQIAIFYLWRLVNIDLVSLSSSNVHKQSDGKIMALL